MRERPTRGEGTGRPPGAPGSEVLALLIGVSVALVVMVALITYLWVWA